VDILFLEKFPLKSAWNKYCFGRASKVSAASSQRRTGVSIHRDPWDPAPSNNLVWGRTVAEPPNILDMQFMKRTFEV